MDTQQERTPGKVVTFYSYKGGTGRSMVLANTAWILASQGKRVLVIDWDLEAPGLHRYFQPFLLDPDLATSEGLIDFVVDYQLCTYRPPSATLPTPAPPPNGDDDASAEMAAAPVAVQEAQEGSGRTGQATLSIEMKDGGRSTTMVLPAGKKRDPAMQEHAKRVERCILSLEWEFPGQGALDFIPAGQQGPGYAARVNSFNWSDFYRVNRGEELFHEVRELLRLDYDFILVDSRTGVSDTSGICTVQMPDAVVVCFTLNNQGIQGAAGIARSVVDQRRERPVEVFPVPMRVENAEKEKVESRKAFAQRQFEHIHFTLPGGESRATYWNNVLFPYVPFYAYEEILATFGDRQADATSLIAPALRLAGYLNGGGEIPFTPPTEEVRAEILTKYAENSAMVVERTPTRRAREAEEIFARLSPEEQKAAYQVFTRMVKLSEPGEGADTWVQVPLAALDDTERRVARQFHGSALELVPRNNGGEIVQAADEELLTCWKRLATWTVEDRDFQLWRRRLAGTLSEWVRAERDPSELLTGARLDAAARWAAERGDRLTAREAEFIRKSVERHRRRQRSLMQQRAWGMAALVILLALAAYAWTETRATEQRSRQAQEQYARTLDSMRVAGLVRSGSDNTQVGNYDRAIEDFQAAIALDSANPVAFFGLGNASYQSGDLVTSVSALSQAVRTNPGYWAAYDVRARAYLETGDTARAIADLQQVLALAPDSVKQDRQARLQQISAERVPVDPRVTVNILYRSRDEASIARGVQRELGSAGFRVLVVEFRSEDSRVPVRYFYPQDSAQAELVAARVRSALLEVGIERPITAQQIQNYRNLPEGRIEVWLPVLGAQTAQTSTSPQGPERRTVRGEVRPLPGTTRLPPPQTQAVSPPR